MYDEPVVAGQVLARQCRPEIFVAALHLFQHGTSKLRPIGPVRLLAAVPVLQSLGAAPPVSRPNPLGLSITQLQQLCRLCQPQAPHLHPSHHFGPTQFLAAQLPSPQSESLLAGATLKGATST